MSLIVLTGAAGFIGRVLAARLAREGHSVRAVTRREDRIAGAQEHRIVGDLLGADLDALLDDADAVIHCAARVHVLSTVGSNSDAAEHERMNAVLPVRLAEAARSAGVRHFVQLSSAAAVASSSGPSETITDATPPRPLTPYGRCKLAGDLALAELVSTDFAVTSIRPPAVYGPGAGALFAKFGQAARLGLPLPLRGVENRRSFLFSGNLADAIVATLDRPKSGAWLLTDSDPVSAARLYDLMTRFAGHGKRTFQVPEPVVRGLANRVLGSRADSLLGDAAFDGVRFRRDFAWSPPVSFEGAVEETVKAMTR